MTKNTASSQGMALWPEGLVRLTQSRWWSTGLGLVPWLGLAALLGQFWSKSGTWTLVDAPAVVKVIGSSKWWLAQGWRLLVAVIVLPLLGLVVDAIKWSLIMEDDEDPHRSWWNRVQKNIPILCYGILGSLWFPARLTEFAGRCRFYPKDQHPRVMVSTWLSSSTQWVWVLLVPALAWWLVDPSSKARWAVQWSWAPLDSVWLSVVLGGLAILAGWAWFTIFRKMQAYTQTYHLPVALQAWSFLRHLLLLGQWAFWLELLGLKMDGASVYFLVAMVLAVNWFAPLGVLGELGLRGLSAFLVFGPLLPVPTHSMLVPWLIWFTNVVFPALVGGSWWLLRGRRKWRAL